MNAKNLKNIMVITIALIMLSCGNKADLRGKLEGKVKRESISIAPKVAGRIVKIMVKESDIVKAGDTLAIIDIPDIEAKLLQTQGAFISAKAQYEMAQHGATKYERSQINAKFSSDKEQYEFAKKSYDRLNNMFKDSLISQQKYDEMYAKYTSAKAQFDATTAQRNDVDAGIRPEKVQMAMGDMKRAEGAYKEALSAYAEKYILAPKAMSIETVALKEGELLLPGYNLIVGYETEGSYFRFTLSEKDINKYKKGEEYKVNVPDKKLTIVCKLVGVKQFASYADKTSSYADYKAGETVYELKLIPVNAQNMNDLYANMNAYLEDK